MATPRSRRPVFLDLTKIRMPVGALTSIGHRISGVVLTIGVPVVVYLLALSLEDEQSFARVSSLLRLVPVRAALVILVWALSHHVLAGVRHLLSDFDIGSPLRAARRSAWLVNLGGVALAVFAVGVLL
jgi:succinate dehydrogenase / fumarate reductase cytochrome b subunit